MDLGSPHDWQYLAEGGANIVLSYTGRSASLRGHVLRLRKRSRHQKKKLDNSSNDSKRDPAVLFYETFVKHALPDIAASLREVPLLPDFLRQGWPLWQAARPQKRKTAAEGDCDVDLDRPSAVLAENMVQSPDSSHRVLAIEIKPKWGFLPDARSLSEATRDVKMKQCRFCRHARVKGRGTHYCPLDLFALEERRMSRAIGRLWEDWVASEGQTNNFRVFVDGAAVKPHETSRLQSILRDHSGAGQSSDKSDLKDQLVAILQPTLLDSPVLPKLLRVQSQLDPIDIEGIHRRLKQEVDIDLSEFDSALSEAFLSRLQAAGLSGEPSEAELRTLATEYRKSEEGTGQPVSQHSRLRELLVAYLVSAAVKDCSFFVKVEFSPSGAKQRVKVVDLDMKPMKKMPYYYALDQQLALPSL